ncbi:MAG: hypothetical protein LRS48_01765 [Desulfurococcales archaeon]|nr:hypothetical protein [Desulfurococcales archaeon]
MNGERTLFAVAGVVFILAIILGMLGFARANSLPAVGALRQSECGGHSYGLDLNRIALLYETSTTYYFPGGASLSEPEGVVIFSVYNATCSNGIVVAYLYTPLTGIRPYVANVSSNPATLLFVLPTDVMGKDGWPNTTMSASTLKGAWNSISIIYDQGSTKGIAGNATYNVKSAFKYDGNTGILTEAERSFTLASNIGTVNSSVPIKIVSSMKLAGADIRVGEKSYSGLIKTMRTYVTVVYASALLLVSGIIGLAYILVTYLESSLRSVS